MKTKIIVLFLMLNTGMWIIPQKTSAQVSVSFQVFYDELSPYGTWVDYPSYGYVWMPSVDAGFSPYSTAGHWVFTEYGWTWVSDYAWGWAPFHYGRWNYDNSYGWFWVPQNEWGPGWVSWRRSDEYYGWAPIGYGSGYNVPYNHWRFVRGGDFGRTNINNYYINSSNNVTIINKSTVINNNKGPDRSEVEKRVGKPITPIAIKESGKPGQNLSKDQLEIYRPKVQKNNSTGSKPAPSKVASLKDVKPTAKKTAETQKQKTNQTVKQQQPQPKQTTPSQKVEGGKQIQKDHPSPKTGEEKKSQNTNQQVKQQPSQPKQSSQPAKQQTQPSQPQHSGQPAKQQQHNIQPNKEQHPQHQPAQQQPPQRQQSGQPPQQANPPKNIGGENHPH